MAKTLGRYRFRIGVVIAVAGALILPALWSNSARAADELSPGCTALNDPAFDATYTSESLANGEFYPNEELVFTAGPPDTVTNGASLRLWMNGNSVQSAYPGTLSYVVDAFDWPDLYPMWEIRHFIGIPAEATWNVSCRRVAGFISGRITGDSSDPYLHELTLGKADLFTEDGDYVATYEANGADGGTYATDWLEEGWYYVLLYNGEGDSFIDFFPEWYRSTPLYKSTTSNLIHVYDGEVSGIDAQLQLGFIDMWDSVFASDIVWMQFSGITRGCGNDLYCPDGSVTRGQMAAFLARALDLTDDGGGNLFIDDDDSIFEGDIDRLATAGITRGCNPPANDRFCPGSRVTRSQMAAFLVRAMGYTYDGAGDLFVDDDGSIFESDIDRLAAAGVTRGCNPPANSRFCPDAYVTRGQMAAFLHRALGGVLYPASVDDKSPRTRTLSHGTR